MVSTAENHEDMEPWFLEGNASFSSISSDFEMNRRKHTYPKKSFQAYFRAVLDLKDEERLLTILTRIQNRRTAEETATVTAVGTLFLDLVTEEIFSFLYKIDDDPGLRKISPNIDLDTYIVADDSFMNALGYLLTSNCRWPIMYKLLLESGACAYKTFGSDGMTPLCQCTINAIQSIDHNSKVTRSDAVWHIRDSIAIIECVQLLLDNGAEVDHMCAAKLIHALERHMCWPFAHGRGEAHDFIIHLAVLLGNCKSDYQAPIKEKIEQCRSSFEFGEYNGYRIVERRWNSEHT